MSEYAAGQTVRLLTDVELDDGSTAYAGETAMIVGFIRVGVVDRVILDYLDADTGEHLDAVVDPWQLYRVTATVRR